MFSRNNKSTAPEPGASALSAGGNDGLTPPETPATGSTTPKLGNKPDPFAQQGTLRSASVSGESTLKKVSDEEAPIRALPPVDFTRFDFLQVDDSHLSFFPPQRQELGLGMFRKLFSTLNERFSLGDSDEIHVQHFERAMRRVLRVIGDEDTVFRSEKYDVDGSGAIGWWEFVAVWKNSVFDIKLTFLERVFLVFEEPSSCLVAKWLSFFLLLTIMFSSILFIIATLPEYRVWPSKACETTCDVPVTVRQTWSQDTVDHCRDQCQPKALEIFDQMEAGCVVIFTAEYLLRLLTCHACRPEVLSEEYLLKLCLGEYSLARRHGRLKRVWDFATSYMNLVDVLAIVPFYMELIVGGSGVQGSTVLRVVRLTRLFRFMKVAKYVNTITVIAKVFTRSFLALAVLLFVLILFVTVSASIMYFAESGNWDPVAKTWTRNNWVSNEMEATPFKSIPHSMWWSFVTYTTVGYGDMAPYSLVGQLAGIISMLTALLVVAMPTSVLLNNFTDVWTEHHADVHVQQQQTQIERETVENVMQFEEPEALLRRIQIEVYDENVLGEFLFLGEVLLEFDLIGKNLDVIPKAEKEGLRSLRTRSRSRYGDDGPSGRDRASKGGALGKEKDAKKLKLAPVEFDLNHFHGKIEAPLQNNIMKTVKSGMSEQLHAQGSIEVELKWTPFPAAGPDAAPPVKHGNTTYHPGALTVKMIRARYLYPAHESDEYIGEKIASPHAHVCVWPKVPSSSDVKLPFVSLRTKTVHDDVNPVWNEELTFDFYWKSQDEIDKEAAAAQKLRRQGSLVSSLPQAASGVGAIAAGANQMMMVPMTPTSPHPLLGASAGAGAMMMPPMGPTSTMVDEEQIANIMRSVLESHSAPWRSMTPPGGGGGGGPGNGAAGLDSDAVAQLRQELRESRKEMKRLFEQSGAAVGSGVPHPLMESMPAAGGGMLDLQAISREMVETRKTLQQLVHRIGTTGVQQGGLGASSPANLGGAAAGQQVPGEQQARGRAANNRGRSRSRNDLAEDAEPGGDSLDDLYPGSRSNSRNRRENALVAAGSRILGGSSVDGLPTGLEYDIIRMREDIRDVRRGVAELLELTRGGNVIVLPGGGPRRGVFQNHLLD